MYTDEEEKEEKMQSIRNATVTLNKTKQIKKEKNIHNNKKQGNNKNKSLAYSQYPPLSHTFLYQCKVGGEGNAQ